MIPESLPPSPKPSAKIDAKEIFTNVTTEVSKGRERRTDASHWIDGLKDPRNIVVKYFMGGLVETEDQERTANNYQQVKTQLDEYGVSIPEEILESLRTKGYIDDNEAKELKKLAYNAEQAAKFKDQLDKCDNFEITGNLKDFSENPTDKELLSYCTTLKTWITKSNAFPDAVTDSADPRVFKFFFEGKMDKVPVNTKDDLEDLQKKLKKCHEGRIISPSEKSHTLNALDPFGTKERAIERDERRKVLEQITKLGEDKREVWDKVYGFFGRKTEHLEELREENKQIFRNLKIRFNAAVTGSNFRNDVIKQMSPDVQKKIEDGERLTDEEVNQLQAHTLRAMQRQRYIDELKNVVPGAIEGNLKSEFDGKMPEKEVFEKYLHKLKEALIKSNYPGLITSHADVHKFIFFILPKGEYKEITVNSLKDLDELEGYIRQCVVYAENLIPDEQKPENVIPSLRQEVRNQRELIEQLQKKNDRLEKESQERLETLEATAEHTKKAIASLGTTEEKLAEMEKLVVTQSDRAESYKVQYDLDQVEIADLRKEVVRVQTENTELQQKAQSSERRYTAQRKMLDELRLQQDQDREKIAQLESDLEKKTKENEESSKRITARAAQAAEAKAVSIMTSIQQRYNQNVQILTTNLSEAEARNRELARKNEALEEQLAALRAKQ